MRVTFRRSCLSALSLSIFVPAVSLAAEATLADRVSRLEATIAALQAENRDLRARIDELELRLQAPGPGQRAPAPNPGWKDRTSWRGLRRGMTEKEDEALLGPPAKVEIGASIGYWIYSPTQGIVGPHVKFSPSDMTVYGWQEP